MLSGAARAVAARASGRSQAGRRACCSQALICTSLHRASSSLVSKRASCLFTANGEA